MFRCNVQRLTKNITGCVLQLHTAYVHKQPQQQLQYESDDAVDPAVFTPTGFSLVE